MKTIYECDKCGMRFDKSVINIPAVPAFHYPSLHIHLGGSRQEPPPVKAGRGRKRGKNMKTDHITGAAHDLYKALNALVIHANTEVGPIPEELWVQAEKALDKAEGKEETR